MRSNALPNPGGLLHSGVPLTRRKIEDRVPELPARTDAQLCEHLPEVPLDGAGAKEESRADLQVRQALTGEPRNVELLGGQLLCALDAPPERLAADQGEFF